MTTSRSNKHLCKSVKRLTESVGALSDCVAEQHTDIAEMKKKTKDNKQAIMTMRNAFITHLATSTATPYRTIGDMFEISESRVSQIATKSSKTKDSTPCSETEPTNNIILFRVANGE